LHYVYKTLDKGELVDVYMSYEEKQKIEDENGIITLDSGEKAQFDWEATFKGTPSHPGNWPLSSIGASVDPAQVPEAEKFCKDNGVPTKFNGSGEPVFTGPGHRRKFLKLHGMHDKAAYI